MGGLVILGRLVVTSVPWDMLVGQLQLVRALLAVNQLTERLHTMLIAKLLLAVHLISYQQAYAKYSKHVRGILVVLLRLSLPLISQVALAR